MFFPFLLDRSKPRGEDRISNLPSDILVSIISRLTVREATSTSILSSRWRHLHAYITHLNFTKYEFVDIHLYKSRYELDNVNHVLNSHKGSRIKEFRFDTYRRGMFDEIERCFEFALTRKAEIIHISPSHHTFHRLPDRNGLKCLKDLSLINIEMTDQYFQFVVSNCHVLECLTIKNSRKLENVSIVGPSKLKHLNLSFLKRMRSMVICDAISLVSLTCFKCRSECSMQLSNIPKLTKLNLRDGRKSRTQVEFLSQMPYCIREQLQLLRLSYEHYSSSRMYKLNLEYLNNSWLQFINIKYLELVLDTTTIHDCYYVSRYACRWVEVCDSLEKLVIKFLPWKMMDTTGEVEFNAKTYDHRPRCELSQKHLEILGYSGSQSEREMILYIIDNAMSLQKLIINKTCLTNICNIRFFRGNWKWLGSIILLPYSFDASVFHDFDYMEAVMLKCGVFILSLTVLLLLYSSMNIE